MLALYRSGRHAEALIAFQRVRTWMAEEFGLDPCPSLSELNAAILRRDPALDASDPSCCRRAALGAVGTAGAASSIA